MDKSNITAHNIMSTGLVMIVVGLFVADASIAYAVGNPAVAFILAGIEAVVGGIIATIIATDM